MIRELARYISGARSAQITSIKVLALSVALGLSAISSTSLANPFELYGVGSRASALGNLGTASADDYTAVHYNPAALLSGRSSLGGGVSYAAKQLEVKLTDRPAGYEIPDLGASSPTVPSEYLLQPRRGREGTDHTWTMYTGLSSDLGTRDLRFGLLLSLPVYHSTESYPSTFPDEREQHFTNQVSFSLLGGRVEHFVAEFGLAYQLFDWLALGVGASVMPNVFTRNFVYMPDAARQDAVNLNLDLKTETQWRLIGGLIVKPNRRFKIGVSYRDEQYMSIRGVNEVQVRGLQGGEGYPFEQNLHIITDYSPRQFTYGGAWFGDHNMFTADLVYTVWSSYLDQHGDPVDFEDTWSPRLGYEHNLGLDQKIRIGLRWDPSPVPEQTGRSNFVDNDRAVVSIGGGHPIKIADKRLTISWHVQLHSLIGRSHTKAIPASLETCERDTRALCDEVPDDTMNPRTGEPYPEAEGLQTGNPGFPGYSSGGLIVQTGIEVLWSF